MATQPSLRIGDRERDAVAAELQEHFAHGRLTLEEFNQRLDAVFAAKTQRDLGRITSDLPHVRSGGAPLPSSRTGSSTGLPGRPGRSAMATTWAGPAWAGGELPGLVWSAGGPARKWSDGDWSYGAKRRPRGRFALLTTLIAVLASWAIVYDVILVGVRFPLPGRLGLLIAVFAIVRGVLRRIVRGPRGHR
jgi:hypothetical protein